MHTLTILPSDSFIAAALAELLDDVTHLLASAKAQTPIDRDEVRFWARQLNALNKADYQWLTGVRPAVSGDAYLIPSASRPGSLVHRLTRLGGVIVCGCEAGQKGILCHHHMLINVIERAAELETAHDEEEATAAERATMGRRLCQARRQYQEV